MARLTIEQLKKFKESEDKVEFKKAEQGNFAYDGGIRIKHNIGTLKSAQLFMNCMKTR